MSSSPAPPPVYYHPHPSEDQMGSGEGGDEKRRKLNDDHHGNLNANVDQQQQQHNPYLMQPPPPPHGYYGGPTVDGQQPPQDHAPPMYQYPPYQPGPYSPTGAPPPPQFFNGNLQQYYPAPHPLEGVATQHNPQYDDVMAPEPCHIPKDQQYNEQWNNEAATTTAQHEPTILPRACHLPPRVNDNNNNEYNNNNYYDNRPVKQQALPQVLHNPEQQGNTDQVSSPGQTYNNNETTPTNVNIDNNTNSNNDTITLDTRSPEGSRNLNTLEERIPTVDDDDEVQVVVQQQPQLEEEPQLPQEPGQVDTMEPQAVVHEEQFGNNNNVPPVDSQMIPYGMPPPPPGMQWAPQPGYNHGPPPMPPSPQHAAAYPPPHHHPPHPGMPPQPQFSGAPPGQPQFQMMSSPGMHQAPPGVVGPNGEVVWPCDHCNIKFSTWEDCSAHEATCPSGVNQHQRRLDAHAAAAAAAYGGGNHNHQQHPPPHPMYGPVPGMAPPPMLQPPQQQYHLSPYQAPVIPLTKANTTKSRRDRKREQMAGYPQRNGHILIDDNAEYALNADRTTFLLSTPADADSLSDRQCYVRSHFVEVFVADEKDVQARHSRGAQKLNVGQVGMRCAYCAKLRPRDRAERAICYPSSISRIYQTVADMQRFHFENCVAIPAKVLDMYKQLKTTRPRGMGSPGMYWDRSAHEMGLMDTPLGIQAVSRNASDKVDDIAAMTIDEVGRLVLQKKSLVSGMLERLDSKPHEHVPDPSMMLANDLVDQVDMPQVKDEEVPLGGGTTFKPQPMTEQHQDPQASTLPPSIEEPASPGGIQTKGSNVISSPGSSADQSKDGTAAAAGGTDAPSTPNEDANILLMLKNTDSPPQAVDDDENVAKEEKEETLVVAV